MLPGCLFSQRVLRMAQVSVVAGRRHFSVQTALRSAAGEDAAARDTRWNRLMENEGSWRGVTLPTPHLCRSFRLCKLQQFRTPLPSVCSAHQYRIESRILKCSGSWFRVLVTEKRIQVLSRYNARQCEDAGSLDLPFVSQTDTVMSLLYAG